MNNPSPTLDFHLQWPDSDSIALVNIHAMVNQHPVWPVQGDDSSDLEVFADDILSFLAENWHTIFLEQTYPVCHPTRPSKLRHLVEFEWDRNDARDTESDDIQLEAYEHSHNFATCFAGLTGLPPLWFMRRSEVMLVDNGENCWEVAYQVAQAALERLGDSIAQRLFHEPKFQQLIDAWHKRAEKNPLLLLATATGTSPERAASFVNARLLRAPENFGEAANDDDELRIAARMIGSLDQEQAHSILVAAKRVPRGDSAQLDQARKFVSQSSMNLPLSRRPHDIGRDAAIAAREFFGYSSAQKIKLKPVLLQLGVPLITADGLASSFKGMAIWGRQHGPGIVIASSNVRPYDSYFHRVTIAHELGHLLMDGDHTVTAVDVLHGRVSPDIEQRAKSFAGEFLLPSKTAAERWLRNGLPKSAAELASLLKRLQRDFGITKSVAAWKLEHGLKSLDVNLSSLLDQIAPER